MTMMGSCGGLMMAVAGIAMLLGLGLVASLVVLTWVVIGRLRHDATRGSARGAA